MADFVNSPLVSRYPVCKPIEYLFALAAHGVLAEPAILVVLHLEVFVHDVGPFLQVLELVVFDLRVATSSLVLDNFSGILVLNGIFFSALLRIDQVDNFQDLGLDVVLVDKGQNLVFYCWEVGYLENRGSLVVVFVEQCHD